MKKPYKSKSIKSKNTDKHYSGEESPYWNFMEAIKRKNSGHGQDGNHVPEDPLANPDNLAETDSLYHRPLTEIGQLQLAAIKDVMRELSPQQKQVLQLCGFEGQTLQSAAATLGIKLATVQTFLERARRKIKVRYQELLKEEKPVS